MSDRLIFADYFIVGSIGFERMSASVQRVCREKIKETKIFSISKRIKNLSKAGNLPFLSFIKMKVLRTEHHLFFSVSLGANKFKVFLKLS